MKDELNLNIPEPVFGSHLVELIMKLETLRGQQFHLSINPILFLQVRKIFHMIESLQSARIEGNRTTIADYVSSKYEKKYINEETEEIQNIENAIEYTNECFDQDPNFKISKFFIKELHNIVMKNLINDGSKEIGKFRTCQVKINNASHIPPDAVHVNTYIEELVNWINEKHSCQYQLLKVAIAHHAFTWIHPFDNGNGRLSRMLTYAMLRQYGYELIFLLNSTAIFCINREKYFDMLQKADTNTDEGRLVWCEYVLEGLKDELTKMNKLMDKSFFVTNIVKPAINRAVELHYISHDYKKILEMSLNKEDCVIKSKDIQELFKEKNIRQISHLINKMISENLLMKTSDNSRSYIINLLSKDLARGIIDSLHKENLINFG